MTIQTQPIFNTVYEGWLIGTARPFKLSRQKAFYCVNQFPHFRGLCEVTIQTEPIFSTIYEEWVIGTARPFELSRQKAFYCPVG